MTGLFDSIIDSISSMDASDVISLGAKGYSALSGASSAKSGYEQLKESNSLAANSSSLDSTKVSSTPTKALQSVSPEQLEQQWLARLNKFANMQSNTSVKPR